MARAPKKVEYPTCVRHQTPRKDVRLRHFFLCNACSNQWSAEAFDGNAPLYVGEAIQGYCLLCNRPGRRVRLRTWFLCDICYRVAASIGRNHVAEQAILGFWDERVKPKFPALRLVRNDPASLRPRRATDQSGVAPLDLKSKRLPCGNSGCRDRQLFRGPSWDSFFCWGQWLRFRLTSCFRWVDHRLAILVHLGRDPTLLYQALVTRKSAALFRDFASWGDKAVSARLLQPATSDRSPTNLWDVNCFRRKKGSRTAGAVPVFRREDKKLPGERLSALRQPLTRPGEQPPPSGGPRAIGDQARRSERKAAARWGDYFRDWSVTRPPVWGKRRT